MCGLGAIPGSSMRLKFAILLLLLVFAFIVPFGSGPSASGFEVDTWVLTPGEFGVLQGLR
jgi:hypothetical protein